MKINWWRVAAISMLLLSVAGHLIALFLDTDALGWVTPVFVSLLLVRLEWFIAALNESKETHDESLP
mgnify:CR=1 FL=1